MILDITGKPLASKETPREKRVPANLEILRVQLRDTLNHFTNAAYSQGIKYKYEAELVKGEGEIQLSLNKKTKQYYTFRIFFLDKTTVEHLKITLYERHYPSNIDNPIIKVEEQGIKDLFINASASYFDKLYTEMINKFSSKGKTETNSKEKVEADIAKIVDNLKSK